MFLALKTPKTVWLVICVFDTILHSVFFRMLQGKISDTFSLPSLGQSVMNKLGLKDSLNGLKLT